MSLYIAALFLVLFLSLFMILLVGGRMEVRGLCPCWPCCQACACGP